MSLEAETGCEIPLRRLMGLETEYALNSSESRSHRDTYEEIIAALKRRMPCADADVARSGKPGIFLATGGAVWFESLMPTRSIGLIEGATPECRGVRQLITCQRAQDRLLQDAAKDADARLLKNDCDSQGRPYGAQENYEVTLDTGWRLRLFQFGVVGVLLPLAIGVQLAIIAPLLAMAALTALTSLIYLGRRLLGRYRNCNELRQGFDFWIGRVYRKGWDGQEIPLGGWAAIPLLALILVVAAPVSAVCWLMIWPTRLGRLHRRLAPFLASRVIFAGAGHLDKEGHFHVAGKAPSRRSVVGVPEYSAGLFSIGQFIKPCLTLVRIGELTCERQRVQISIGDSNLCEEAEYLRVGTTALLIDAYESETFSAATIRVSRPVVALHRFAADPSFESTVMAIGHGPVTAIELQRMYWQICRDYVDHVRAKASISQPDQPLESTMAVAMDEAEDILQRWRTVLDLLVSDPELLIGRVDWVTKRFLLNQVASSDCAVRKKIDLKYHQLNEAGYHARFSRSDYAVSIVDPMQLQCALAAPPPDSPAQERAERIRRYASNGGKASWTT